MSEFMEIKGYPNYSINKEGQVKSADKLVRRGKRNGNGCHYIILKGRILKSGLDGKGYPNVCLYNSEGQKHLRIHRLLAEAFIPNPENKPDVNHINGDKADFALNNLEWCTKSENMYHAFTTGLAKANPTRGEKNHMSVLNEQDVRNIRAEYKLGDTTQDRLAAKYRMSKGAIKHILRRRSWKHV